MSIGVIDKEIPFITSGMASDLIPVSGPTSGWREPE